MGVTSFVTRVEAIKYDGGNGPAVVDFINTIADAHGANMGWTLLSVAESAGVISVTTDSVFSNLTITIGQWVVFTPFNLAVVASDAAFAAYYRPFHPGTAFGARGIPGPIALNATVNLDVQLSRAFADNAYVPHALLVGGAAQLNLGAPVRVDANTVRVPVTAILAYASGAHLLVVAHGTVL